MGGVAVLHPQDVLRDRLSYNRMPLISRSPNFTPISDSNPRSVPNSNPKSVSNSNRRKRSPQKKNNDVSRSPPSKSPNLGHNFEGRNGLTRSTAKGVVENLSRGKISSAHKLEMGKVKILKRGEALTTDEKVEKKTASFDEAKNVEKKTASFDEAKNDEKVVVLREDYDKKLKHDIESIEMMLMRLGPEPEMVPKQINLANFYAGSAFVTSPDPSSVPVPDFFKKKTQEIDPSSHLRMLLNLTF